MMRMIPKPWGGEKWLDVLAKRKACERGGRWLAVDQEGVEHLVITFHETAAVFCLRLNLWPLHIPRE